MKTIGAHEAKTYLPQHLDRVACGESLAIARHGRPVALLVPVATDRERARAAAAHIAERLRRLKRSPLADLMKTIQEGQKY